MRDGDWKLLVNYDGTRVELYNLSIDKKESENIADQYPAVVNKLKPMAIKWFDDSFRKHAGELVNPAN